MPLLKGLQVGQGDKATALEGAADSLRIELGRAVLTLEKAGLLRAGAALQMPVGVVTCNSHMRGFMSVPVW